MATILELARELRHHIVSHSTGRLQISFPDHLRSIDFSDGTIVSSREDLLPCLEEAASKFSFSSMTIPPPDALQSGAALLIEAMESVDGDAIQRIWKPYQDWTVLLPQDPDLHNSVVSSHTNKGTGRLRRMLRLAVSGALTLEPRVARSINEAIEHIRKATGRGDYWRALNVDRSSSSDEIKKAYRNLVRRFHPDRWHSTDDQDLKERTAGAFRDVQHCYERAIQAVPRSLPAPSAPSPSEPRPAAMGVAPEPVRKLVQEPRVATPRPRPQPFQVASYTVFDQEPQRAPDSLFRRIFEKVFKAA